MKNLRSVLSILAAVGLMSQVAVAHDEGRRQVARAAHDVAYRGEHFHRAIHNVTGYSHLANDAHRFAQAADHFHHTVEGNASTWHVRRDYQQLQSQYWHLSQTFRHAHAIHHNHHVQNDWMRLEHAARHLNYAMRAWLGGGHGFNPYFPDHE